MTENNSYQCCGHILGDKFQGQAALVENGIETRYCSPCLEERISALLPTTAPSAFPYLLKFTECGHYPDNTQSKCVPCYASVMGVLISSWSYLHLQGDRKAANRLGGVIRAMARHYGPVTMGVIGPDQFTE